MTAHIKTKTLMIIGCLLIVVSILFFAYDLGFMYPPRFPGERTVEIPRGASPGKVGAILKRAGIINSESDFVLYVRLTGNSNNLQEGTFVFSSGLSTPQVVELVAK